MNFSHHPPESHCVLRAHALSQVIPYHEDAALLFAHCGALSRDYSLLLESAEINTSEAVTAHADRSLAIVDTHLVLRCYGSRVLVEAQTASGRALAAALRAHLPHFLVSTADGVDEYSCAADMSIMDEKERLLSTSSLLLLRTIHSLCRESILSLSQEPGGCVDLMPFLGGGFAFDFIDSFESLPSVSLSPDCFPDYEFLLAATLLEVNHRDKYSALHGVDFFLTPEDSTVAHTALSERIAAHSAACAEPFTPPPTSAPSSTFTTTALLDDDAYAHIVTQLQEHIYSGDIYQVVPARTFTAPCTDAFAGYRELRRLNPSPYMFYFRGRSMPGWGSGCVEKQDAHQEIPFELFGASPESNLTFDSRTRRIGLYPIAGTRPRGRGSDGTIDPELDIRAELELRTDAKEIAEHIMLVDLARNDMARVSASPQDCPPRDWRRVDTLMNVDRYSHVMHLVSRVSTTLHPDLDALDAYRACMNMGTLTGAPKIRATELLREVEGERRGSYGGAVGYLAGAGDFDTCITIRSAFVRDSVAYVRAGAGVVRDSDPLAEAAETRHKAAAVLTALAHVSRETSEKTTARNHTH